MSPQSSKTIEGGPSELLPSQPLLNPWKFDGAPHSGGHLLHERQVMRSQHGLTKGKTCLFNLIAFYNENPMWMDWGKALGIVCLDLSKVFNTVSHYFHIEKLRKCRQGKCTLNGLRTG